MKNAAEETDVADVPNVKLTFGSNNSFRSFRLVK